MLHFHCMPAGRHSDSTPDCRRVCLCSQFLCGSYGAGSPTAVVCSPELVGCGGTLCRSCRVGTRGHVSSVCTYMGSLHLCAFFVSCVFRRESVVFPGRILISYGFLIFLAVDLQHLRVTTESRRLTIVNLRQQQHSNTVGTSLPILLRR